MSIFHGIEIKNVTDVARSFREVDTSVIAIAGTAMSGEVGKIYKIASLEEAMEIFSKDDKGNLIFPDKDDNSYTLLKSLSAMLKQFNVRPSIYAVRAGEKKVEVKKNPAVAEGNFDLLEGASSKFTWKSNGDNATEASFVAHSSGEGGEMKLAFKGLSKGGGAAEFKIDLGALDFSLTKNIKFDVRRETKNHYDIRLVVETSEDKKSFISKPYSMKNEDITTIDLNLHEKSFKTSDSEVFDKKITDLNDVKAIYFKISAYSDEPHDAALHISNIRTTSLPAIEEASAFSEGVNPVSNAIESFLKVNSSFGLKPNILIAPILSQEKAVADKLFEVARKLKALAVIDRSKPESPEEAFENSYKSTEGNSRLKVVYPNIIMNVEGKVGFSAIWAAMRAKVDNDLGYWVSCSNRGVLGVEGLETDVEYIRGEPCEADDLNKSNVTTMIREGSWRIWGNRTLGDGEEHAYSFVVARRTGDAIDNAVINNTFWAIDSGITQAFISEITASVGDFLRDLKANGAIYGGECWFDPKKNPAEKLKDGKITFTYDYSTISPAEKIIMESVITDRYIAEVFS